MFSIHLHIYSIPGADLPKRHVWFSVLWIPIFACFNAVCLCGCLWTLPLHAAVVLTSLEGSTGHFLGSSSLCFYKYTENHKDLFRKAVIFSFRLFLSIFEVTSSNYIKMQKHLNFYSTTKLRENPFITRVASMVMILYVGAVLPLVRRLCFQYHVFVCLCQQDYTTAIELSWNLVKDPKKKLLS